MMKKEQVRTSITLPDDILPKLDKLKKNKFYDKSKTQMYQHLIRIGLEKTEREDKEADKEAG